MGGKLDHEDRGRAVLASPCLLFAEPMLSQKDGIVEPVSVAHKAGVCKRHGLTLNQYVKHTWSGISLPFCFPEISSREAAYS